MPRKLAEKPRPGTKKETVRHAVAVDADAKSSNLMRLRRIEGQIRGLQKMVEDIEPVNAAGLLKTRSDFHQRHG